MTTDAMNEKLLDSPLISAYLTSLKRTLGHAEDRDEVVASVREHIVEALSSKPDPRSIEVVREVLAELGPVEQITNLSEDSAAATIQGYRTRSSSTIIAVVISFISLALVFLVPFVAVPLAIGSLTAGIFVLRSHTRPGVAGWLATAVSGATLLIAIFGALFFLPAGNPTPENFVPEKFITPAPEESVSVPE